MKKVLQILGTIALFILIIPLLFLAGIFSLFTLPFNLIRYRKSHYYRDFGHKYSMSIFYSMRYRLYNLCMEKGIDLQMVSSDEKDCEYGYFVHDNALIVTDIRDVYFDNEESAWGISDEDPNHEDGEFLRLADLLAQAVQDVQNILHSDTPYRAVLLADALQFENDDEEFARKNKMFLVCDTDDMHEQITSFLRTWDMEGAT